MKNLNIIIFEDEKIFANTLKLILSKYNHNVEIFDLPFSKKSVEEIFEYFKEVNVILMDIKLNNEDGKIISKYIRRLGIEIPIVFITGNIDEEIRKEVKEIKKSFYLNKPIDKNELIMTVQTAGYMR